jgi:molecular chaperone Hsp33
MLAATVEDHELVDPSLPPERLLFRLFNEEVVRLYDRESVRFRCSCSQDRTLAALAAIGEAEIRSILEEQGSITMDCEFCNQRYVFREGDLRGLIDPPPAPDAIH